MQKMGKLNPSIDIIPLQGSSGDYRSRHVDNKHRMDQRLFRDQSLIERVQTVMYSYTPGLVEVIPFDCFFHVIHSTAIHDDHDHDAYASHKVYKDCIETYMDVHAIRSISKVPFFLTCYIYMFRSTCTKMKIKFISM